jgi:hypothetical protein
MVGKKSLSLDATIEQVLAQGHGPMPVDGFATRLLAFIHGQLSHDYSSDVGAPRRERESAIALIYDHDEQRL